MNTKRYQAVAEDSSRTNGRESPEEHEQPPIEWLLEVLVDPARRRLLETLRTGTDGQLIDGLLEPVRERDDQTQTELRAVLYHQQLPKLEDVGLVEIDWDRKLIYYRPDARIEALLDAISAVSTEWESLEQPRPTTGNSDFVDRVRRALASLRRGR
ncbi:ArsR/SmtB family transcription factor [Natronorubrum halophilum]|uniref:ArsR/SmtB family transcription factor n=1 Tax=Natronorubrum halophilum TaxID=1702106 RepID=UPI000EF6BA13|nr:helix-turn-helix transcriptional regulator [Natronorubrum halophilum]